MFQLVDAEKAHYPVRVLCEALGISRSGFYAWKKRPPATRVASDEQLAVEIAATHAKSTRRYGSPRVHRALRKRGIRVGKKRVARLMRANGIVGRRKRRFNRWHRTRCRRGRERGPRVRATPPPSSSSEEVECRHDRGTASHEISFSVSCRRL